MKIAFIGYKKQERYSVGTQSDEDAMLLDFLSTRGFDIIRVVWDDPSVDWEQYDTAILKSPWDYHEKFPAFNTWLDKIEAAGIELLNPYQVIRWNADKHYLKDIVRSGLPVISSFFMEKDTRPQLDVFFERLGTQKLIVKPCVSASAKNTMIVDPGNVMELQEGLYDLLKEDSFIVQPFVEEILQGELSLIFLGGIYSHSVLKLPKSGDFRVQHFHGGTIRVYEPSTELIATAEKYVRQFAAGCLYARVDGLFIEGVFQLMELELIEPYLFLDTSPGAYRRYYEALLRVTDS